MDEMNFPIVDFNTWFIIEILHREFPEVDKKLLAKEAISILVYQLTGV